MYIGQDTAPNFIQRAVDGAVNIKDNFMNVQEGISDSIKAIGDLSEIIVKCIDWIWTVITNPVIILTFVDQMSIVIIMVLVILKLIGFEKLDKWIVLLLIIKVVACVLL